MRDLPIPKKLKKNVRIMNTIQSLAETKRKKMASHHREKVILKTVMLCIHVTHCRHK